MECLFEIGQRIVAIKDHSQGDFVKDDEFTVLDIGTMCEGYVIKIREGNAPTVYWCEHRQPYFFNGRYYLQGLFAPVQDVERGEMTFEEAMKFIEPRKVTAQEFIDID